MKNIWTIFKREFKSYFDTPIGYIFLIVFWLISIGIYMIPFFKLPSADMSRYFWLLPFILCVFVPSVTMRLWAEEKKLNTFEMLQTFPMSSTQIVIGKYLASITFYLIALAGTLTVPLMLIILGDPDGGVVVSSYVGAFLLGALFLSMGLFFSGFCRDQIIAYVITLLSLLGLYLLGADVLNTILPFKLGSLLQDVLGVTEHYNEFSKGVIDLIHVLYFVVWTVLFLFLNGFYLESRSRKGAGLMFAGALALCLGIGLVFNLFISTTSLGRFDLTEHKLYTLSEGSVRILKNLKAPVNVTLYVSPREEMPEEIKNLERDIASKLEEMEVKSGGNMKLRTIYLSTQKYLEAREKEYKDIISKLKGEEKEKAEEKLEKEKEIEEKLYEKGVTPFNLGVMREGGTQMSQWVYSSIAIDYKEKDSEFVNQISPNRVGRLEYEVMEKIYRLSQEKKPVIALVAPQSTIPEYIMRMYMQMGRPLPPQQDPFSDLQEFLSKDFEVKRVSVTKESPLPDDFNILMVISPENLEQRQLWEINRAVLEGKPAVIAANHHRFRYTLKGRMIQIEDNMANSGLNSMLEKYGVKISDDILMSKNSVEVGAQISQQANPNMRMMARLDAPVNMLILRDSMNSESVITNRLEKMFFMWGSAINIEKKTTEENKLKITDLITTGKSAWQETRAKFTADPSIRTKKPPMVLDEYPVAILAEGQFPDAFEGKMRPKWAPKQQQPGMPPQPQDDNEAPPQPPAPAPGKMVLVGNGIIFSNDLFMEVPDSQKFIVNAVDALSGATDIIGVRTKEVISRIIQKKDISDFSINMWKIVNIGGFSILFVICGVIYYFLRKQGRRAYRESLSA